MLQTVDDLAAIHGVHIPMFVNSSHMHPVATRRALLILFSLYKFLAKDVADRIVATNPHMLNSDVMFQACLSKNSPKIHWFLPAPRAFLAPFLAPRKAKSRERRQQRLLGDKKIDQFSILKGGRIFVMF